MSKRRRKPYACPVPGCGKRGGHGDLMRHAAAVHPKIARHVYETALLAKQPVAPARTRGSWLIPIITGVLGVVVLLIILTSR